MSAAVLDPAVRSLVLNLLALISLLLVIYVLLDLARTFVAGVPEIVRTVHNALGRLWQPILRPLRQLLPPLGGMDFSPLVVILALQFLSALIR